MLLARAIGIAPGQFVAVVACTQLVESLAHANLRLGFGRLGERLLVGPRFHRLHHAVGSGHESRGPGSLGGCNFAVLLPVWDVLFRTADFSPASAADRHPRPAARSRRARLRARLLGAAAARAGATGARARRAASCGACTRRRAPRLAMRLLLDAFWRAAAYCLHPRVILLSFLPLLLAGGGTVLLGYFYWEDALSAVRATLESWSLVAALLAVARQRRRGGLSQRVRAAGGGRAGAAGDRRRLAAAGGRC